MRNINVNDVSRMQSFGDALRQNIQLFQENLTLSSDGLLDVLLSNGCLNSSDYDQIRAKQTNTEQVRLLIVRIKDSCPESTDKFMVALKQNVAYTHLFNKMENDLSDIVNTKRNVICVICYMVATVLIDHVVDVLWQEGVIPDGMYSDLATHAPDLKKGELIWEHILLTLSVFESVDAAIDVLKRALDKKYSHIAFYLDKLPKQNPFGCCCCNRRKLRPRAAYIRDSLSEISTTSTPIYSNIIGGRIA